MPWGDNLENELAGSGLERIAVQLAASVVDVLRRRRHGHFDKWTGIMEALPALHPSACDFSVDKVLIGAATDCDLTTRQTLRELLHELQPWRKGPFEVFGVTIDSEWRSHMKWRRLQDHIQPLRGRVALDVGCGNGYYMYRMLGAGARFVLGIDPSRLFTMQFEALKKYTPWMDAMVLPLRFDELPLACLRAGGGLFDSVFSMGVLYHRRQPRQHLSGLFDCLKPGGELILETLSIEGRGEGVLRPQGAYAKMPNVHLIPTEATLYKMLEGTGFGHIRTVSVSRTQPSEQRRTVWMNGQSLSDFLDPANPDLTIEGYPAPRRIIMICSKPGTITPPLRGSRRSRAAGEG